MFFRVFLSALIAAVLGGTIMTGVQSVTTTPLILQAEKYETKASAPAATGVQPAVFTLVQEQGHTHDHGAAGGQHDHGDAWAPEDGLQRTFFTGMANVLAGFGFALLIVGGFALSGRRVDMTSGVLWGLGGFAVFTLAPGLGLPPELPGTAAADLGVRQGWWLFAAAATALGLSLVVFRQGLLAKALGLFAIVVPHAIGAPHPAALTNAVPPELAAHFASSSIVTAAVFWVLLGSIAAYAYQRLEKPDVSSEAEPIQA